MKALRMRDGRQVKIERATAADAAAMIEYVEAIAGETDFLTFGPGEFGVSLQDEAVFLRSLEDHANGIMLQAKVDGLIVANAMLARGKRPRLAHVGELGLSVRRSFWGNGIGRALCTSLFEEAKNMGIRRIALRTRADNHGAIALYEKLGFAHEGRLMGAMTVGGIDYDELVMGLQIPCAS